MSRKNNALPEEQQGKLIGMLNRRLADAIDLQLQSRQAITSRSNCWSTATAPCSCG